MSNILSIDNITKGFADKILLKDVSFGVNRNEKVAITGMNGCGKSSILKIIAGLDTVDSGRVVLTRNLEVSYLSQLPDYNPDHTISEHIFFHPDPVMALIQKYEEICSFLSHDDLKAAEREDLEARMNELHEQLQDNNAFEYEDKIRSTLRELGIDDLQQKMSELSGGKLKKVALAQTLIRSFDLLLLDEPTNHLDVETIIWLQKYLEKMEAALILITHDRYFLENIVERIFEIDSGKLYKYDGAYSHYLDERAQRDELSSRIQKKQNNFLRTELEWLSRQPKARGTKQKARIDKIQDTVDNKVVLTTNNMEFSVSGRRLGKKILELKKISKSFGDQLLFDDFSHTFKQNERIGLIGPNGCGKTSLLNIMTGESKVDSGSVDKGINTRFGYFNQTPMEFNSQKRVLQFVKDEIGEWIESDDGSKMSASKMLEMFQFDSRLQSASVTKLSGGEKRRLQLVCVLMKNPNFLILDEPTNDLDLDTLQRLEHFLLSFGACLVVVSHDRYFLDRVVDQLLVIENKKVSGFLGSFSSYLQHKIDAALSLKKSHKPQHSKKSSKQSGSFKSKQEFKSLEIKIANWETRKQELEKSLSTEGQDHAALQKQSQELGQIIADLEKGYLEWERLAALVGD